MESSVIVAFHSMTHGLKLQELLLNRGVQVSDICCSGAEILRVVPKYDCGVVICTFKLPDIGAYKLYEMLPEGFGLIVLLSAEQNTFYTEENIICQTMPVNTVRLVESIYKLSQYNKRNPLKNSTKTVKIRSDEEIETLKAAKELLMKKYEMTEDQAHRFIQKQSMDRGKKLIEVAQLMLNIK